MKMFYIDFYTSLTYDGDVLVRYPLPCLALALLLVAQLLVAGITRTVPAPFRDTAAQIPDPALSSFTLTAPEIDGDIQDSEWAGAAKLDIVMSGSDSDIPGSIRVMNDENNLYIALTIQDNSSLYSNILQLRFDDNHDGLLAPGEDVFYYDPLSPTNFDSFVIADPLELVGYDRTLEAPWMETSRRQKGQIAIIMNFHTPCVHLMMIMIFAFLQEVAWESLSCTVCLELNL